MPSIIASQLLLLLLCCTILGHGSAFTVDSTTKRTATANLTPLASTPTMSTVISPDDTDFQFDTGLGGVRLAQESAVRLTGTIKHGAHNTAKATFKALQRYTAVQAVPDHVVQGTFDQMGAILMCTGRGQELYQDPGTTSLEKVVVLGPAAAATDAARGARPAPDADTVVLNVLGGDDLQFLEVQAALENLVPQLVTGKAKITFNSLCHSQFPLGQVTITAVALPAEASSNGLEGVAKAVADGQVYFREGEWWTVVDSDINPALA